LGKSDSVQFCTELYTISSPINHGAIEDVAGGKEVDP